jgi:hypothetical protein
VSRKEEGQREREREKNLMKIQHSPGKRLHMDKLGDFPLSLQPPVIGGFKVVFPQQLVQVTKSREKKPR